MTKQQSITALPPSPDEERRSRMVKYLITMGIRFACVILVFFVQGWWLLVVVVGAIVLPYIAVVLANVARPSTATVVVRPGAIVPIAPTSTEDSP